MIGFAAAALQADLDALADTGCTGQAVIVDDEVALASVLATVVSSSILVERCNGEDDDCDGLHTADGRRENRRVEFHIEDATGSSM